MADDRVLSMSLDEIIKLKKTGENSESRKQTKPYIGARGKGATYHVKPGKTRISAVRGQIRRRGGGSLARFTNTRGINRRQGVNAFRGYPLRRNYNLNLNRQRQYHIALGRNKLQMAKRFLNQRQRGGAIRGITVFRNAGQPTRFSGRGMGQRFRRGITGINNTRLIPNTFRSDQILRLSRLSAYRNKLNRTLSAVTHNQEATIPSLIVSIENERAGLNAGNTVRGMRRRRGGLTGNMQQTSAFRRTSGIAYQTPNPLPYHTGSLDPDIQMVIAGIQGKRKPNAFGRMNTGSRRGQSGLGRFQRFGRTQLPIGRVENFRRHGSIPLGMTANTLNERFGGLT